MKAKSINAHEKGKRWERDFVKKMKKAGCTAYRHAGSGAFEGLEGDGTVFLPAGIGRVTFEAKNKAACYPKTLERWLEKDNLTVLHQDHDQDYRIYTRGSLWETIIARLAELEAELAAAKEGADEALR